MRRIAEPSPDAAPTEIDAALRHRHLAGVTWTWIWPFNYLSLALLILAALRWGAGPERMCMAAMVLMNVGDRAYHAFLGRGTIYASVDIGHLFIDLAAAAIFVGVALRANRVYPLWLSAFQLVSVVSHFAREVNGTFATFAYALMNYGPYYAILAILSGGIWCHARRRRRYGPYPSWRRSSNPSRATAPPSPPTG